jgi:hypothetical protein
LVFGIPASDVMRRVGTEVLLLDISAWAGKGRLKPGGPFFCRFYF